MTTRKLFQFHLRPTKKQTAALQFHLDECRFLYNQLLEQRKISYEELGESLTKYQQLNFLPFLKQERPSLFLIHSQILQNVCDRLDKSYQTFFRRVKNGEATGFPKFKEFNQYNSFCLTQNGFSLVDGCVQLSMIGVVKLKMHKDIQGTIKTCTIKKNSLGSWLVTFSCEIESNPLPILKSSVGIDVGLTTFAVFSDGKSVRNSRFSKKEKLALVKAQRNLSKKDLYCQESIKIIDQYQYICIEDLSIKKMIGKNSLSKSIADASWGLSGKP